MTQSHVLILGAGIAGLAAANELKKHAFDVTLLEGRDRIGGRIWTDRSFKKPVDLGAQVIHGIEKNPITELAKKMRLKTIAADYESYRLFDLNGNRIPDAVVRQNMNLFLKLMKQAKTQAKELNRDISLRDGLERIHVEELEHADTQILNWARESATAFSGAEFHEHSLKFYDQANEYEGANVLFPDGYDQIFDAFSEINRSQILLNHKVTKIEWKDPEICVMAAGKIFTSKAVLITVPLGVLQSGDLEFVPELPVWKRSAIEHLGMGLLDLIILEFPEVFWPKDRDFIGITTHPSGEFPRFYNRYRFTGIPILTGLMAGDFARSMEPLSDPEILASAMKVLRRTFGQSVPEPVQFKMTRWANDLFSRGSYSYIPVHASEDDYDALAEPLERRLFFAGEATNRDHPSTVHGAYLSGLREALRITAQNKAAAV